MENNDNRPSAGVAYLVAMVLLVLLVLLIAAVCVAGGGLR